MARNAQYLIDEAARILSESQDHENYQKKSAGIRNLIYASSCPKTLVPILTKLVNGTLANVETLTQVAHEAGVDTDDITGSNERKWEFAVVLYECLLGSRRVRGTSSIVQLVKNHKAQLQQTLAASRKRGDAREYAYAYQKKIPEEEKDEEVSKKKSYKHKEPLLLPRYVRVNTLTCSMKQACDYLKQTYGMSQTTLSKIKSETTTTKLKSSSNTIPRLPAGTFVIDPYIDTLLLLPPGTNLHGDDFVRQGKFILQHRSSCLTALALLPLPESKYKYTNHKNGGAHAYRVVDTCAAPGNKTLHLASLLMSNRSGGVGSKQIVAFERSPARLATLQRRIRQCGAADLVQTVGADFLTADLTDYADTVTHALVDPSCSGSGLVELDDDDDDHSNNKNGTDPTTTSYQYNHGNNPVAPQQQTHLAALANEQVALVTRAMRDLPNLQVLAYSTCSIHVQENEHVVRRILNSNPSWELVTALPHWPHRGMALLDRNNSNYNNDINSNDIAAKVVRASLQEDSTHGFFVARFEKRNRTRTGTKQNNDDPADSADAANAAEQQGNVDRFARAKKSNKEKKKKRKREDDNNYDGSSHKSAGTAQQEGRTSKKSKKETKKILDDVDEDNNNNSHHNHEIKKKDKKKKKNRKEPREP